MEPACCRAAATSPRRSMDAITMQQADLHSLTVGAVPPGSHPWITPVGHESRHVPTCAIPARVARRRAVVIDRIERGAHEVGQTRDALRGTREGRVASK